MIEEDIHYKYAEARKYSNIDSNRVQIQTPVIVHPLRNRHVQDL